MAPHIQSAFSITQNLILLSAAPLSSGLLPQCADRVGRLLECHPALRWRSLVALQAIGDGENYRGFYISFGLNTDQSRLTLVNAFYISRLRCSVRYLRHS